jgi:hypothetical protein
VAIHSGKYVPKFIEHEIEAGDPFALAVAGKQRESIEAAKKLALSGKSKSRQETPDHDLKVHVRVLPTLQSYASSIRYRIKSREWGKHDGMSLFITKVEKVKRGDARLKGRSTIKSNMFVYEQYRKQALGLMSSQQQNLGAVTEDNSTKKPKRESSSLSNKGRVKRTPRVMRMFQVKFIISNHDG